MKFPFYPYNQIRQFMSVTILLRFANCNYEADMSGQKKCLLLFTSYLGLLAETSPAHAAVNRHTKPKPHAAKHAASVPQKPSTPESVSVTASRLTSHGMEQTITRKTMDAFVPGTSPLQVLSATTPGVSFASDDRSWLKILEQGLSPGSKRPFSQLFS